MSEESVVIQGTVLPDGTLRLSDPLRLPPGPVEVVVRSVTPKRGETLTAVMAKIDAERTSWPDYVPRTAEEIDASIREMRDEWEERQVAIEQLQEECQRQRERTSAEGTSS